MTPLEERVREAEREVGRCDRELRQRVDELSRHARGAAHTGGRLALAGAGVAAMAWLGMRMASRLRHRPAREGRGEAVRTPAARAAPPRADAPRADASHGWQRWWRLGLLLVPLVAPARSPAVAMASAARGGGHWPLRLVRLARAALDWRTRRQRAPAAGGAATQRR
ncbi:hypothetical protein V4F39_19870 [Aquincola sp. MAHUQ-54]|uniref:DUF3618 domain-containing protein n=1 Tax=Aquincola agrisoli TaxID=3119538 RepID=A0AAW9QKU9_9BURK